MIVNFKNTTLNTVIIELQDECIELKSGMEISVNSETNRIAFNCYSNQSSNFKTIKFVVFNYNYILNSSYDLLLNSETVFIKLVEKEIHGDHVETYKFIDVISDNISVIDNQFEIKDEAYAKQQILNYEKQEKKATKIVKVIDVLQSICYIGLPFGIIFFGVWYYSNILTALYIIVPLSVIAVIVGLLVRKILNKFNKKLDEIIDDDDKDKHDLYVDKWSYFEKEYIYSVVRSNK